MSIDASYGIIEYMRSVFSEIIEPDEIEFYPGRFSPKSSDNTFATYKVIPNVDYDQPYIHVDNIRVIVYHTSFDLLQRMTSSLISKLNNESAYDNEALMQAGIDEGVRYQDVVARVHGNDHNEFIDNVEFHSMTIDIMFQYVRSD